MKEAHVVPAIYLLAVVVLGFAATLLRLPPLVGFLAAGFVLGASDLPNLDFVQTLGDLGVAVLLFTIGLKLDPRVLARREVAGTAAIALVLLTTLSAALVVPLLLVGLWVDTFTPAGAVALCFALSFSSTVVVVKLLEDRGNAASLYGRIAIGVLVAQDIAAVAYMTFSSEEPPSPWALSLVALWPASRLFGKVLNRIDHREMRTLFGMSMAACSASTATSARSSWAPCSPPTRLPRSSPAPCSPSRSSSWWDSSWRSAWTGSPVPAPSSSPLRSSCCCRCERWSTPSSCASCACAGAPR